MKTDTVSVHDEGPVRIITITRPEVRNAVNPETATALYEAFLAFDADPDAAVAVLTGEGGAFCAGFDLSRAANGMPEDWFERHAIHGPEDMEGGPRPARWGRRGCGCPSRSSPPSRGRRSRAAWSWPCGATCG